MVLLENFNISLFETRNHVVGFILTFLLFSFSLLDCTSVDASHYGGLSAKHAPLRWKQFGIASILGGIPRIFWRRRGRNFPQMSIKMSATSAKKQKQKQVKGSTDMQLASFENLRHLLASRESSAKKNLQILSQTNLKKKMWTKKNRVKPCTNHQEERERMLSLESLASHQRCQESLERLFLPSHISIRNKTRNIEWFPCARSNLWHPSGILRILKKKPIGNPVKPWKKNDNNWLKLIENHEQVKTQRKTSKNPLEPVETR